MTPMPSHVMPVQKAHADLMYAVDTAIEGLRMSPAAALMIAYIGDQELRAGAIIERAYYTGKNATYNLKSLEAQGFIQSRDGKDKRERLVSLTREGLALAEHIRKALSQRERKEAA